jgi:uncharacterized membrane protein YidH (DUF202 family)
MTEPGAPAPGAARERTGLAWRRTALAATVVALLFGRLAGTRAAVGLAVLAVPGWVLVLALARHRTRTLDRDTPLRWTPALVALALLSTVVFGTAPVVLP